MVSEPSGALTVGLMCGYHFLYECGYEVISAINHSSYVVLVIVLDRITKECIFTIYVVEFYEDEYGVCVNDSCVR